ncbi:phosphoribosylglycinamide formyltransferase [Marilutibacter maris]|uniref:Phosphoribosylglycinamide formyltransferase n=1 Tax=Marilutibacter maris TaxID=1605891 RepID=A0A2U9T6J3_9GAMM|nr:phosphoribosylglycinamide formyltransferase [Lysobacter maris]AWV06564.1 phosphoribosylglycinamide formyltransferase [Lysobacter maris]KAB8188699.1 phosphoribosylglycinamide formyltransferase [Lysobacter maris]
MRRIAVLASGRGSNLQALIDAIAAGRLAAEVVGVFSDRAGAGALERARAAGIAAVSLRPRDFDSRPAFDEALFSRIDGVQPDLIVCAGYMRLLSEHVVEARAGRMINIHPSLLPAFKGLHTHQQALDAGATEHGASVHFVTAELDGGPVIAQARVPVLPGDDAARLAERVLAREHPLLLATVGALVEGRVRLLAGRVADRGRPLAAPLQLGDDDRLLG